MNITLEPGKYVMAVSGGVDSMVLLDAARQQPGVGLIVAHFDHGIREDSAEDRKLVQRTAKEHDLTFEFTEGRLGVGVSEDTARKARYEFLHKIRQKYGADAIVTAHHQDDLLETAILNLLRGTGRKGLSSLQSTDTIKRPLLHHPKHELLDYAKAHAINWREDTTNQDTSYLRNYIRKHIISKLTQPKRDEFIKLLSEAQSRNQELDTQIANFLQYKEANSRNVDKKLFINLPHAAACEVMAGWLRQNNIRDFDRKAIERLVIAAKTFRSRQRVDINSLNYLLIDKTHLELKSFDR